MDYKLTLNLPFTIFSMKAYLAIKEQTIIKFWEKNNLYKEKKNKKKKFILNDGPPYANGDIHIGHAFNKILKDIIIKFKMLCDYEVSFIPGWDCHGLPIELNIEKKIKNKIINKNYFRKLCKKYALEQIYIQKKSFLRLGISSTYKNLYTTMSENFEFAIIKSFEKIFENNFIYNGYKPIYWCFDCKSALAEAEIEYNIINSDSIYVFFEIYDINFFKKKFSINNFKKIGLVIWTTTPWTIPFNEAVAIKENFTYVFLKNENICYLLAETMVSIFIKKNKIEKYDILLFLNSAILKDTLLKHPFYNKKVKIIYSNHVKIDSGTGCVHIAPSHGYDDYKLGLMHNLPIINYIDEKGYFSSLVEYFSLMHIHEVDKKVLEILENKKNLIFKEKILHKYPHCWRHKTQLIFRTTTQWFFNITKNRFKEKINKSINTIKWVPKAGKNKMLLMFENRLDWCISRQRTWGVPIILFINKENIVHNKSFKILKKSLLLIRKFGVEFWYKLNVYKIFIIDKKIYNKVYDVLDVWFDSSSAYNYISIKKNIKPSFNLCVEGNDQYRGWFQVSLLNSLSNYNKIPYKTILSHGFVLDENKKKMSKSLKNVISPNDIVKNYGADILRLWSSSVNYCFDVSISNEILNRVSETYRKIRNTFRFFLSNLYDFKHNDYNVNNFFEIDFWILSKFNKFKNEIIKNYLNYKFYTVYKKICIFFIDELGSKYLDIIKERLYTMNFNSNFRKSAQITIFYLLYNLSKLIAPILCFTAEDVWSFLPVKDSKSVFSSNFKICIKKIKKIKYNIYDSIFWKKIFNLKSVINKIIEKKRTENICGKSIEMRIIFFCNIYWKNILLKIKKEKTFIFSVSKVKITSFIKVKNKIDYFQIYGIYIKIIKSNYDKCERCWCRINKYISINNKNLKICRRCIINLYYFN